MECGKKVKIIANKNIQHIINDGLCETTNRSINVIVFQGKNGCFYEKHPITKKEKLYTGFFHNLKILKNK